MRSEGEKWAFEDLNKDVVFQLLSIFNPVYLFHLFLAELHYDHRVILDCLVSEYTGASCAEYLLTAVESTTDSNTHSSQINFKFPDISQIKTEFQIKPLFPKSNQIPIQNLTELLLHTRQSYLPKSSSNIVAAADLQTNYLFSKLISSHSKSKLPCHLSVLNDALRI